jgi:hypothetical protein
MRSMDCARALGTVGATTVLVLGCSRSTPVPRESAPARSVFTDTVLYRRHCVVPTGRPVDLKQPCLLLDQGRPPRPLPPPPRP